MTGPSRIFALFALLSWITPGLVCAAFADPEIRYEKDIRPILKAHCFQCHGEAGKHEGGLDLRLRRLIVAGGESGPAIIPGKVAESHLLDRIRSGEMPPEEGSLGEEEIDLIARWIAQARAANDGSLAFKRGLAVLEGLLREIVPPRTSLLAAYPNPFNPDVWIPYELSAAEPITVTIYDARASAVRRYNLGTLPPGLYITRSAAVHWDGQNSAGERATSGTYFVELRTDSTREVRRIILRK